MSFTHRNNLRLVARNEGKIKSYESCSDIRAWSHDVTARDRYLREWMKADMPVCVLPTSTLSVCLRTMTYKSRSKATPRCHPDCKSKVLLESICASCDAVRECLQQDENLEKYFLEEEFETSHWPCDRCLEALKCIKMFWKIIIDKLFHINVPKCETFAPNCLPTNSVRTIAKVWQAEILHEALIVKNLTPALSKVSNGLRCKIPTQKCLNLSRRSLKSCPADAGDEKKNYGNSNISSIKHSEQNFANEKMSCKKVSKCTCFKTDMVDAGCNTCSTDGKNKEMKFCKKNIQVLQNKYNCQSLEMEKLRKENNSLKMELEKIYTSCPWKTPSFVPDCDHCGINVVPKPFEAKVKTKCPAKSIDSEMIITMKNCKNENFRHVSLLQVLHKTNDPIVRNIKYENGTCCKKEDPIEILNKVQNTFGAIVQREISIINQRRCRPKKTEVDASYHQVNTSKSAPSCSTLSSQLSSECEFISTKEFSEKNSAVITNII